MVMALRDQFSHLVKCILPTVRHMHRDVRDLCPDQNALFITQIIKFLCVLIMCQPDRICSDLADKLHIQFMVFPCQCISYARLILMTGNTAQRIGTSIQTEALLRIKLQFPAAEFQRHRIFFLPVIQKNRFCLIEIRIFRPIPEVHIFQSNFCAGISITDRRNCILISNEKMHLLTAYAPCFQLYNSTLCTKIYDRGNFQSRCSIHRQFKMLCRNDYQVHVTVKAAIKCKVCFLRIDIIVFAVIHRNGKDIFFPEMFRQVHTKR